jgi:hypothetical protein
MMLVEDDEGNRFAICHVCEISGPPRRDQVTPPGWKQRTAYELDDDGAMLVVDERPVFIHIHLCPLHRDHTGFEPWPQQQVKRIKSLYKSGKPKPKRRKSTLRHS